jgi:hypothetical protein
LIVTGELVGHAILGPKLETSGTVTETDDDVVWGISYAGVGVNWYSASNLYLHGSAGPLMMTIESDTMDREDTDVGFGSKLGVGYEWWLGREIGLGVGLELMAGRVKADDVDWNVGTLGLALSATYN